MGELLHLTGRELNDEQIEHWTKQLESAERQVDYAKRMLGYDTTLEVIDTEEEDALMDVAPRELCAELYQLSGWDDNNSNISFIYCHSNPRRVPIDWDTQDYHEHVPAYDTNFLLEQLPSSLPSRFYEGREARLWTRKDTDEDEFGNKKDIYSAWYFVNGDPDVMPDFGETGGTPQEAYCKLAIRLFKDGYASRSHPED